MARPPKTDRRPTSTEDILACLRRQGIEYSHTRSGHYRIATPDGPAFIASTPSDGRAIRNAIALLRHKGVQI